LRFINKNLILLNLNFKWIFILTKIYSNNQVIISRNLLNIKNEIIKTN
jgi:hypothetical protein